MNVSVLLLSMNGVLSRSPTFHFTAKMAMPRLSMARSQFIHTYSPIVLSFSQLAAKFSTSCFRFCLDTPVVLSLTVVSSTNYSSNPLSLTDTPVSFTNCVFADALSSNVAGGLYVTNSACNFSCYYCTFLRCVSTNTYGWTAGGLVVRASAIATVYGVTFSTCSHSVDQPSYTFSSGSGDSLSVDINSSVEINGGKYNGYTCTVCSHSGAGNRLCISKTNHTSLYASARTAGFNVATSPSGATFIQYNIVMNCTGKAFLLLVLCVNSFNITNSVFCNNTITPGAMIELYGSTASLGLLDCVIINASSLTATYQTTSSSVVVSFIRCCFDSLVQVTSNNKFIQTQIGHCFNTGIFTVKSLFEKLNEGIAVAAVFEIIFVID